MSALTVVETDLACEREKQRVTTRQSPTTDTHRFGFGCGFDLTARTRGVSYPGTTATTDPRRRRRDDDDDDANATTRTKTFHSHRASPRVASRPIARATSVPSSSSLIIARGARYAATHPSPRTARATRFPPRAREDASNASTRIDTRTWTLVALKAATRPTKEEARSADIVRCHRVCWNDDRVDRSIEVECFGFVWCRTRTHRRGFRVLVYERLVGYSIRACVASNSTDIGWGSRGTH